MVFQVLLKRRCPRFKMLEPYNYPDAKSMHVGLPFRLVGVLATVKRAEELLAQQQMSGKATRMGSALSPPAAATP